MPLSSSDFSKMSADVLLKLRTELDEFIQATGKNHVEMDQEDAKIMQGSLAFRSCPEETYLIVIAVHKDPRKNSLTRIKCHRGTPLGGYAYDTVNDSYCVECVDHFALGLVPISFQATMGKWSSYIPLPENVLMKYLTEKQRVNLKQYKENFSPPAEYTFEFLQLLH